MNRKLSIWVSIGLIIMAIIPVFAQKQKPDSVYTGIYITSIHDIDFRQKEYTINLWLWMKYKNRDFNFLQNLEVPMAKTVNTSFATIDSSGEYVRIMMKLQCVMKDNWKISKFPFDRQKLRLSFENSQFDSKSLVFVADTIGKHFDSRFTLSGWQIDTFNISVKTKVYETGFGDESLSLPKSEYSAYRVKIGLRREAMGLFWKLFLGMYVSFLIAFVCFFVDLGQMESRFGLSVGALFGVIGNKYIIDSSLPETTTFTLVDTLHGLTLAFILCVVISTVVAYKLFKSSNEKLAIVFDKWSGRALLFLYVTISALSILNAISG